MDVPSEKTKVDDGTSANSVSSETKWSPDRKCTRCEAWAAIFEPCTCEDDWSKIAAAHMKTRCGETICYTSKNCTGDL